LSFDIGNDKNFVGIYKNFVGNALSILSFRKEYNLNILAIHEGNEKISAIKPNMGLMEDDILILAEITMVLNTFKKKISIM
jgi:Trk K+ transport system NAD-binding subunit